MTDILDLIARLRDRGEAFAVATVVRTVAATAAKAGAKAVIGADGTVSGGWIGGGCARGAVLKAAREALGDGTARLVSIRPDDALATEGLSAGEMRDGVRFARSACPSRGTMDVFVEPVLPRPLLALWGATPVAEALADLAPRLGLAVAPAADAPPAGAAFAVVATQGRGDTAALRAALASDAGHVAFVGSRAKTAALRDRLLAEGLAPAAFERLRAPAGLDIGAITPEEIALSILAQIVAVRRSGQRGPAPIHPARTDDKDANHPVSGPGLPVR